MVEQDNDHEAGQQRADPMSASAVGREADASGADTPDSERAAPDARPVRRHSWGSKSRRATPSGDEPALEPAAEQADRIEQAGSIGQARDPEIPAVAQRPTADEQPRVEPAQRRPAERSFVEPSQRRPADRSTEGRTAPWRSDAERPGRTSPGRTSPGRTSAGRTSAGPTSPGRAASGDRFSAPRDPRASRGPGRGQYEESAEPRAHNPRDLRSSNRPERERSPEIDEDVRGDELDRVTRAQIRNLEERSAGWVAKHLVMAGRLLADDPELAFQHALAASRRGGRLAAVREAVGLTAYAAGHYGEALREFRTFRRISGSNVHLPVMADCERGLGRPDRALDLARGEEAQALDSAGQVELAMVVSGARADLGQFDAAVAALEIPQLDINRAFSFSPRLFSAYADALEKIGRKDDAARWRRRAVVAGAALGLEEETEPDIVDLIGEEDEDTAVPEVPAALPNQRAPREGTSAETPDE